MTTAQRIDRLELAVAQLTYMSNGAQGLPSLRRQAPAAAELLHEWLNRTEPVGDHFVGRKETTEHHSDERRAP